MGVKVGGQGRCRGAGEAASADAACGSRARRCLCHPCCFPLSFPSLPTPTATLTLAPAPLQAWEGFSKDDVLLLASLSAKWTNQVRPRGTARVNFMGGVVN